ncbi:TPA: TetR/AcrR family transcriptional regulator [Stenotrophomonas maltophilia]|nr:TetR/AcrR family transcriptional regulator [Stenotrophomonas maltophilia]HEL4829924.1 TetR/AcrR family transcriptional regulator [Stenotrophomonas maltophilia]HEL5083875.1 TetR/AcrR family transcriptional regulator [Stenotrophomonas maltophilia]
MQTRSRLLEAARRSIITTGIASATIRGVSEEAGFSLGAFYSNFRSKHDMLVAIMEEQFDELSDSFSQAMEAMQGLNLDASLTALATWLEGLHRERATSRLILELHMHANHDETFGRSYSERRRVYVSKFAKGLKRLYTLNSPPPSMPADQMASGFIALWNGFSVQHEGSRPTQVREIYLAFLRSLFNARPAAPAH